MKRFVICFFILFSFGTFIQCKNVGPAVEMVKVSGKKFRISKTEVTQNLYQQVMNENPSEFKNLENLNELFPVENISWYDAIYFCNKLSAEKKLSPAYFVNEESDVEKWNYVPHCGNIIEEKIECDFNSKGFRLPTNEEWEYAAGGGKKLTYSGAEKMDTVGWYDKNSDEKTHGVGLKEKNGYGLYDMSGNVMEWVWDSSGINRRFYRGGSFLNHDIGCRISRRYDGYASDGTKTIGLRLVQSVR